MSTEAQFNRLPKWAQQEIGRLNADIDYWKTKANVDNDTTRIFVDRMQNDHTFIDEREQVSFGSAEGWHNRITVRLDCDVDNQMHGILVTGGATLKVIPWSSNMLKIGLVER